MPVEELFELLHFLWAKIIEYFLPTLVEQGKTNPTHPLLNQPVQSMSNLDFEKVNQIRDKGNDAFGKNDYNLAHGCYTIAINLYETKMKTMIRNRHITDTLNCYIKTLSNRSLVHARLKNWAESEQDATAVLELEDDNINALNRRGKAREELKNYKGSLEDYQICLEFSQKLKVPKEKEITFRG